MSSADLKTPIQPRKVEFAQVSAQSPTNDRQQIAMQTANRSQRLLGDSVASDTDEQQRLRSESTRVPSTAASLSWRARTPAHDGPSISAVDWSIEGTPSTTGTRSAHRNWGGYGRFQRQRLSPLDSGFGAGRTPGRTVGRAPPNESWMDTAHAAGRHRAETGTPMSNMARGLFTPAPLASPDSSRTSPLQEGELSRWVTVFGFAPGQQSQVLRELRSFGQVLEHRLRKGNWMHVRFESPLQAQAACSRSSRLVNDATMIGIVPCTEPELIWNEHMRREFPGTSLGPGDSTATTPVSALASKTKPTSRSLIAGPERSTNDVYDRVHATKLVAPIEPKRGLLGRIIDAVLNW
ncbi:hypothetical protein CCYA_CCYA16G4220 [Cyanidiococcus yangmingshanensis]|nr:hypothetical protein CCYA_CCYA16G4220 [Cyanidiococcus yangmingshanensis]